VSYDYAKREFLFKPADSSDTIAISSAATNNLFKTTPTLVNVDADGSYGATVTPNGGLQRVASEQRYGIKVGYDGAQQTFSFSSGTTGDTSQIDVNFSVPAFDENGVPSQAVDAQGNRTLVTNLPAATFMGFEVTNTTDSLYSELPSNDAVRGVVSLPAVSRGSSIAVNVNNNFSVDASNNTFVVSVDDVKGTLVIPTGSGYTLDSFIIELEKGINQLASENGNTVSGVSVEYDPNSNGLVFTSGTTGTDSFIKVSGSATWGLANIGSGRGETTTWIKPSQSADEVNGVSINKYIDEFGNETASADGFTTLPEFSPIYLDKGELTFDTSGNLVSPTGGAQLDTVFLAGGRGALNLSIDYTGTTQFSQAFAVKAQSQDGSPEGDLVGVDIGDDGLVVASYSNGSQESLGKIVLTTFASNEGLRQNGDSSYLSSAKSGAATFGEAGTAGFGTIRAGARERSNVDLTTELVGLITAQRNFQANAKAIETSSALTSAIINIRS
jgi:flagellar hook-basal body protein